MSYKIGIDISGGDYAPAEIFKGAVLAKQEYNEDIVLIGVKEEIEAEARRNKVDLSQFSVVDAPEKIDMGESPATAVRRKKNSSITIGINFLKERKIDAFVSCGNTGAAVAASTLMLGLIEGVERPGIGILIPTQAGASLIVDVGANVEPKPTHLFQYGIMASVYYELVLNKPNPTVGLLNIGEEESKGSDFVKHVHKLFSASTLNFTGNVEAKHIFSGKCDCIVCDGFVGNVALKVTEGCAEAMGKFLFDIIMKDPLGLLGLFLIKKSLRKFKRILDYAEYGGAPLLGVNGVVIIGHGRSNALAVKNAIKAGIQELKRDINEKIKAKINEIYQNEQIKQLLSASN
ncbi:MAG: phosphate acyltransferase PlsX [Candidatus Omnitrophota bacterium]|nr:phosphate acyltransferase PlsX [Candidatus Omnitrophota bacterium]